MKTEICSNKNCKQPEKPLSEFSKDKNTKNNLQYWCKECVKQYDKERYLKNKPKDLKKHKKTELAKQGLKQCPKCDKPKPLFGFGNDKNRKDGLYPICKEHRKKWQVKNKGKIAKKGKKYRDNNKQRIAKQRKEHRNNNKEQIAKCQKENYEKNREKRLKQAKEYREKPENKKKMAKYQRRYGRVRRKIDINFKISTNLRTRIWQALKGNNKSLSTMFLVGCDIDYLMWHIQEQFQPGMSWDNHGDWHIDHIKPCIKFDLSKKSEQLKCFNYTNLQPLWAIDNIIKGNKYNG